MTLLGCLGWTQPGGEIEARELRTFGFRFVHSFRVADHPVTMRQNRQPSVFIAKSRPSSAKTSPGKAPMERLQACHASTFRQQFRHASLKSRRLFQVLGWRRAFENAALTR